MNVSALDDQGTDSHRPKRHSHEPCKFLCNIPTSNESESIFENGVTADG